MAKKPAKPAKQFSYNALDTYKRMAQLAAASTNSNLARFRFTEVPGTRGESAYQVDIGSAIIAFVLEGLGTKNLIMEHMMKLQIAKEMYRRTGQSFATALAQDDVAMFVNDLSTCGASPVVIGQHLSVGSDDWFSDARIAEEFVEGWRRAANLARAVWGPGETATLGQVIYPNTAVMGGGAWGIIKPKGRRIRGNIRHGDLILLVQGTGIHSNGSTKAREIAARLPQGYLTPVDGQTFGEALMQPTPIIPPIVDMLLDAHVDVHYVANITGHGWRKFMRPEQPWSYILEEVPEPIALFHFLQKRLGYTDRDMYGYFNMGPVCAFYIGFHTFPRALEMVNNLGFIGTYGGKIYKADEKEVRIVRRGKEDITFGPKDLQIR